MQRGSRLRPAGGQPQRAQGSKGCRRAEKDRVGKGLQRLGGWPDSQAWQAQGAAVG